MDIDVLNELIRVKRRTVKPVNYNEKCVTKEIIQDILENANWAPTHGKTEPWRFTVIQGESRSDLADFLQALYKEIIPESQFNKKKYIHLRKNPMEAPLIITLSMKRQIIEKIPEIEEIEAVAIAAQNMMLTAAAYGLGSFFSTPKIIYNERAKSFLSLGAKDKWLGILYFGYPANGIIKSARDSVDTKVEWRF
jgi:nitroreductase